MEMIPNYSLSVTEDGLKAVYETSLVADPATGKSFLAFSEGEHKLEFKKVQGQERVLSGVWMMPDTKYIRQNENGDFYSVSFTRENLFEALKQYIKGGFANAVKLEHQGRYLQDMIGVEYWIIRDENTLSPIYGNSLKDLGYEPTDIPVGTAMASIFVQDEQFWMDYVMSGLVKGFSIGGLFDMTKTEFSNKTLHERITEDNPDMELPQEGEVSYEDTILTVVDGIIVNQEVKAEEIEMSADVIPAPSEIDDLKKQLEEIMNQLNDLMSQNESLKSDLAEKNKVEKALRKQLDNQPIMASNQFNKKEVTPNNHKVATAIVNGKPINFKPLNS